MKNNLQKVAGSLKNKIPTITVPTAPIPVQTGYAVPIGMACTALESNIMLSVRQTIKPIPQRHHGVPVKPFSLPRQNAKPVSKHPAIMRSSQFMLKIDVLLRAAAIPGVSFQGHLWLRIYENYLISPSGVHFSLNTDHGMLQTDTDRHQRWIILGS